MSFGLPDASVSGIRRVLSSHPSVVECIVYGSRAKGSYRNGSDIDLTLKGEIDADELDRIEAELEELDLPWAIDLSAYTRLDNPELVGHIDLVGKRLWPPPDGRAR